MPSKDTPARAVIYARYSSDNQSEASIEDQVELCRRYLEQHRWRLVDTYADRAISGASDRRPGYQQMLADAASGHFDVIVCEAIDRLGRRLSDVAALHDRLEFTGVQLHATNLGPVSTMHIGMLGTMAQLYLSDLKEKTLRGQMGRVLAGKIPAGNAYGYDLVEGESGNRRINEAEAAVVCRIFRDYAAGKSPRAIARTFNAENIPGPGGREWLDTTIRGQVARGTGILNNALYIGRLEWNRCSYVKDPSTGKRVARPNPHEEWETAEVPHLRIINDQLWEAVKRRQRETTIEMRRNEIGQAMNRAHRRQYLLSGLLKCGVCGGGYTIMGKDRYGCAAHRAKGSCRNATTVKRQEIEGRILDGLRDKLMVPGLVREFTKAYQEELNRLQAEHNQLARQLEQQLKSVRRKIAGIVSAIEDGKYSSTLGNRLAELESEQEELEKRLKNEPGPQVYIHPRLPEIYAREIEQLETALNDPALRQEAAEILRSLIARIELHPRDDGSGVGAVLHGDLAKILNICGEGAKNKPSEGKASEGQISVVAGAGFEPATFRL